MPFCVKCGRELLSNAKFCHRCGTTIRHVKKPTPVALASYKSPIAETYYEEVLRPAAEEKLKKLSPRVRRRETPTKPFEERFKNRS